MLRFALCVAHSVSFDKFSVMCPFYSIIRGRTTALKIHVLLLFIHLPLLIPVVI